MEAVIHPDVIDGEREIGLMGLAFSGPEIVASSVVVPPEVTTEADIEKIILKVIYYLLHPLSIIILINFIYR